MRGIIQWMTGPGVGEGAGRLSRSPGRYQVQVPEATHHAGTANVTSAMTATTVAATQRLPSMLLMVTAHLPGTLGLHC
jgi:hypothetical protein